MLSLMIKKELRDILSSQKFVWAFIVTAILILLSFYIGAKNFQLQQRQFESAQTENTRQMRGLTNWSQVNHHVYLPPDPLYTLVNGIDNDIARNTEIFGVGELVTNDSRYMQDPLFAAFRFLDLQFLFVVVLSLFAVLFGYNMINGEKESGTLSLVFSNPLAKDQFILGKLIGALIAVAIPLLIPMLLGCLLLIIMQIPMNADSWFRLALIIGNGLLLFSFFLTASIFFSAFTTKSSLSFLYMIVTWIFLVLIWPRSAVLIAGRAVDVPSVDTIAFQKARFNSQLWKEEVKQLARYKQPDIADDVEDKTTIMMNDFQEFFSGLSNERYEKNGQFNQKLNQQRDNDKSVQQSVAFSIGRFSPVTNFTLAAVQLAGTGVDLKQRYSENLKRYQQSYASFLRQHIEGPLPGAGMSMRTMNTGAEEAEPIDTSLLPAFTFKKASATDDLVKASFDITLLVIMNLLMFTAAVLRFLKFDLR